jgi:hypothetical protein
MNFVEESDGTILVGKIANALDRSDTTTHRVNALESDNLWRIDGDFGKLRLEVGEIVVLEDDLLGARVADALDHGSVVESVRENDTAGKFGCQGAHCARWKFRVRLVKAESPRNEGKQTSLDIGDIAAAKDESCRFLVQLGQLAFEREVERAVARNVARSASSSSESVERFAVCATPHGQVGLGFPAGRKENVLHSVEYDGVPSHAEVLFLARN